VLSIQAGVDGATSAGDGRRLVPIVAAILVLAALDLLGAALARSWSDHRSIITMVGGMMVFSLLFLVYGKSLDYAELSTVTIGWIVLLQIGVVVLDRLNGVAIPAPKMTAIALILVLQAYLTASDLSS
jgi:hypothetical protein